ncbi:MAG: HAMP domain-containing protein [Piscinibacter sp.]
MKRLGLTGKLFLAVLAMAALVALAMGAAARWNFERGFIGYLNEQALLRMEAALPRLQAAYASHGDWEFVRDRPDVWFGLVGVDLGRMQMRGAPPGTPPQEFVTSDLLGAGRRLTLLDAQRLRVIGFPTIFADSDQREIVVDGRSVGWLVIAPIQTVTEPAALRFVEGQLRASLLIGVRVTLAAALIAWWIARTLLAPVREVARATHRLAAGAYDTRVPVRGQDEVARLAQDFNQLALALERNEQVRRDYMADVSHELRTPLAVLRGELEAMEDGVHPVTPDSLRLLQTEVATLSQLVHDLHELALADVGALTYRKVELDLTALLADECAAARRGCAERGLTLEVEAPGAPVMLQADELRMRQLLHNVLGNALRYTDRGGRAAGAAAQPSLARRCST